MISIRKTVACLRDKAGPWLTLALALSLVLVARSRLPVGPPDRPAARRWSGRLEGIFVAGSFANFILSVAVAGLVAREIWRRRAVDEAFRRSEEQFRGAFEAATIGMAVVDPGGRWLRVNASLCEILGYPEAELLATDAGAIIHPEDREVGRELARHVLDGRIDSYQREERYLHKLGHVVSARVSASLVRDRGGAPVYFVTQVEDISARKRAERLLGDALEALGLANDRLGGIVEGIGDQVAALDLDSRFIVANAAYRADFRRIFGREARLGMRLVNVLADLPEGARLLGHWGRALEGREFTVVEEMGGEGGETRWYEISFSSIRDGRGDRIGSSHVVRDVTERRRAELAAGRERQQLREIIAKAPVALAIFDARMRYLACSARWVAEYGLEGEQLIGRSPFGASRDLPIHWTEACHRCLGGEFLSHPEDVMTGADGTRSHVRWAVHPWLDPEGRVGGVILVTERIDDLVRAREAALAASRLKSDFLANMGHEIRTPLTGVIGMSELLLETELDDTQREYAATIANSGGALLTVINDILDLSRIESDRLVLERADFHLRQLMEEVADLLAPRAHQKGLQITCRYPPDLPTRFAGDPVRVRQVLTNLVGNAVKFTAEGEVSLEARLLARSGSSATLRISVRDTGIGIPASQHASIFESFTQAQGGIGRQFGGSGLGLTLCRRLAWRMGGEIGLESEPGVGSTFWLDLTLPLEAGPPGSAGPPAEGLRGLRVLILDDNATNRRVARDHLLSWGCRPEEAAGLGPALGLLRSAPAEDPFRVVLVDARLIAGRGMRLARAILDDPAPARPSLILVRSLGRRDRTPEIEGLAFDAILIKPVRGSRLLDAIVGALDRRDSPGPRPRDDGGGRASPPPLGLRVLVAEDHDVNRKLVLRMLGQMGCTATAEPDGLGAIRAWEGGGVNLILMDVQMAGMDGLKATAEIRRREAERGTARVPILAMTAHVMESDRARCLAAGMDGHLAKPMSRQDLYDSISAWAGRVAAGPPAPPALDLPALTERCDGDLGFVRDLLESYRDSTPAAIAGLGRALGEGDLGRLADEAHGLKGSSRTIGAVTLAHACRSLEEAARAGDPEAAGRAVAGVADGWDALRPEIDAYLGDEEP